MQQTKEELYKLVENHKSKKEFEDKLSEISIQYDGLLDDDTIALFIIDKLGLNKAARINISDIKTDSDCCIIGTVTKIYDTKTFTRKNGNSGKVANLDISDDSGACRLVLWDKDAEQVENKEIKIGSKLKIINGYTKNGYSGVEINLGRWGLLEVETNNDLDKDISKTDELIGILTDKEPSKAFFKDSGEFGFVTKIKIKQDNQEKQITIWDDKVKEIQKYKIGNHITLENITIKQNNGQIEYHANGNCKIKQFKD